MPKPTCTITLTSLEVDIVRTGLELLMGRTISAGDHTLVPLILTLLTRLSGQGSN